MGVIIAGARGGYAFRLCRSLPFYSGYRARLLFVHFSVGLNGQVVLTKLGREAIRLHYSTTTSPIVYPASPFPLMEPVSMEDRQAMVEFLQAIMPPGLASGAPAVKKATPEQTHTKGQVQRALSVLSQIHKDLETAFNVYVWLTLRVRSFTDPLLQEGMDDAEPASEPEGQVSEGLAHPPGIFPCGSVSQQGNPVAHSFAVERELFTVQSNIAAIETAKIDVSEDNVNGTPPGLCVSEQSASPPAQHKKGDAWAFHKRYADSRSNSRRGGQCWRSSHEGWQAGHVDSRSRSRSWQQRWPAWD